MTVKQLTPEADEAVGSLIEAFRLWLQQLVWLPGCLVTDVTDAATGWIVCRITADAGGTVAGANQRCRWRQLFEISLNDVVDVIYDPRTMMFEIFKPGGATGVGTHALLGTMHDDTTTDAPTRGSLIYVPVGGDWDELGIGTTGFFLKPDGTDISWARFSGQTVMVGPDASTEYNTVTAALAAIGDAAANKPYIILVCGAIITEPGNVTMKDHVDVVGFGDNATIVMGGNDFNMDDDTGLYNVLITFTAGGSLHVSSKDRVILEHVHGTQTSNDDVLYVYGTSSEVECKDCNFESTGNEAVFVKDSAVILFDDCRISADLGAGYGIVMTDTADVTTLGGQITGDVPVGMFLNSVWHHIGCQFDPDTCTLTANEDPMVTGKANFDDVVAFENGVTFDGLTTQNIITIPTGLAVGMTLVDTNAIEYLRVDTDPQLVVHWNQGEVDIDHIISANGITNAVFVEGETGNVGMGRVPSAGHHLHVEDATVTTTVSYYGVRSFHTKTAGVTDASDSLYGLHGEMNLNHVGSTVGDLVGVYGRTRLIAGTVAGDQRGGEFIARIDGGTAAVSVQGIDALVDGNTGTVTSHVYGLRAIVDLEATLTSIGGNVYGGYIEVDADKDPVGSVYMLYLKELSNVDWGIYQDGTADNYFGGNVGIGVPVPATRLEVRNANSEVLRLSGTTANNHLSIYNTDVAGIFSTFFLPGAVCNEAITFYNPVTTSILGIRVRNFGGAFNAISIYHNDAYGGIDTGATPLVLQPLGAGNVGIGTVAPGYQMELARNTYKVLLDPGVTSEYFGILSANGLFGFTQLYDGDLHYYRHENLAAGAVYLTVTRAAGHMYPGTNKAQDLGLAGSRWREIFCSAALNTGTSRLVPVQKNCPVCHVQMIRSTGGLRVTGEDSDFLLAFCPDCGVAAMEELKHRMGITTKPAPKIVLTGMEAVKNSGNTRSVVVNFRYGDDPEGAAPGDGLMLAQKAPHNSTNLSDEEFAAFLAMTDKERKAFLLALGRVEWDALEKMEVIAPELDDEQVRIDSLIQNLIGKDLLKETAGRAVN